MTLYFFLSEISLSNYADDNNLCSIGKELDIITEKLRKGFEVVIIWFFENCMILNSTKCRYMSLGENKERDTFEFENISLNISKQEVILGLTIDFKLSFDGQIKNICRKARQKFFTLSRILVCLDLKQRKINFKGMI